MGSNDILDYLEKNRDRWFSRSEIKGILKEKCGANVLCKLREWNFVEWKLVKGNNNCYYYEYKRKEVKE